LLSAVIKSARRKEATPSALLTRVNTATAGADQLARGLVLELVVAVNATLTGLRRLKIRLIKGGALKPADDVLAHDSRGHFED
jgi:hypothetical protein